MAGLADMRTAIIGALQGLSGEGWYALSGRVRSGYAPYSLASGSGLITNANTGTSGSGALLHVGAGACTDDDDANGNRHPQFEVRVDLWMAIPKDTSANLSGVCSFADVVRRAIHGVLSRGGAIYDAPQVFPDNLVAVYHYTFACRGRGCG
jgi:hypothetical protein